MELHITYNGQAVYTCMGGPHAEYAQPPSQITGDLRSSTDALLCAARAFQTPTTPDKDDAILGARNGFRCFIAAVILSREHGQAAYFESALGVALEVASRNRYVEDWMMRRLDDAAAAFLLNKCLWRAGDPSGDTMGSCDWSGLTEGLMSVSDALDARERAEGLRAGHYFGLEPMG